MLFNSISFLIFFPTVTALYFAIPYRLRWAMLLFASCIFYMWFIPEYILILAITIVIDYFAGILIERSKGKKKKKYLIASIVSTCLVLFFFKYFNFFNSNFSEIAQGLGWNYPIGALQIILPIGLSFHTFQSLSYVIEVYRGSQKAEYHFGIYALYVMFYPQLVAGPIERPQNLLHQFYEKHDFDYVRVTNGLKLIVWGLFKKIVIADRLAILVNKVYGNPSTHDGPAFVIATAFFAIQIYCDFSGYSDIAIGSAQVMGFRLMTNFNRPYFSKSVAEFWKRWHISLSTWFRDYLYLSLGGNRCPKWRWQFNLLFTFLISGLWHGANWTYVVWGALNGFYLVFGLWTQSVRARVCDTLRLTRHPFFLRCWQVTLTFSLVCFSWIFFRAKSLNDGVYIVSHLLEGWSPFFGVMNLFDLPETASKAFLGLDLGVTDMELILDCFLLTFLFSVHLVQRSGSIRQMLAQKPAYIRWVVYYTMISGIVIFGVYGENHFIYFQF